MSKAHRLADILGHMQRAASDACGFVAGMDKEDFMSDRRTQQAVLLGLMIVGDAATQVMDEHVGFVESHPLISWRSLRGMRNRMAHGDFDIKLDVVWDTVQTAVPALWGRLSELQVQQTGGDGPVREGADGGLH